MSTHTILPEKELVSAIKNRKEIAAGILYDSYAATLFKVIFFTVKDLVIAEEILELTFIKVWETIDDYTPQNNRLLLWMAGIARAISKDKTTATATTVYKLVSQQEFDGEFGKSQVILS